MKSRWSLLLALCFSAGIAACSDDAEGDGDGGSGGSSSSSASSGSGGQTASSTGTPAGGAGGEGAVSTGGATGEPSVELTVTPETMAAGDTVAATVTVQNFVLEEPVGQPNEDGYGHFHIYLDDATGIDYLLAGQDPEVNVEIPADTTPGAHTLRVSLGKNNHAPLSPAVEDIVDITVTE